MIILITGATSGIGRAVAKSFANEGATVLLVGRDMCRASQVEKEINEQTSGKAESFICDVSNLENVIKLHKQISDKYNHIDVLFNNAGIFRTSDLESLNFEDWKASFDTNVNSALFMTKYFANMISKGGSIINNASVSGMDSFTSGSKTYMYGTSKAALIKLSKLCALNYSQKFRVNVICPGIIDTEIYINRDYSRFLPGIPMGYVANVDEIAGVVLFLASEYASYITGVVLPIDGGMSLK